MYRYKKADLAIVEPLFSPSPANWRRRAGRVFGKWLERSRGRTALAELDVRMLRDIGIDQIAADEEVRKPFWRG